MRRLTNQELSELRDKEDWKTLWEYAIPFVRFAASTLSTDQREDLIQEGLLRLGTQIHNWNPAESKLPTFAAIVARQGMLRHLSKKQKYNDAAQSIHEETPEEHATPSLAPTYEAAGYTPEGFGDAATELSRQFAREAAETLLTKLDASDSLLLREHLGLPTLDDPAESFLIKDIAAARGIPRETMRRTLNKLQAALGEQQQPVYTPSTLDIYPPAGRQSWRTNQPAAERYPGFWHGMASAMGDTDAWRESVGTVWKDWSWKPSDLDILNGAKP